MKKIFMLAAMFSLLSGSVVMTSCGDDEDEDTNDTSTSTPAGNNGNTGDNTGNNAGNTGDNNTSVGNADKWASLVNEDVKDSGINENGEFYYGGHTYKISGELTAESLSSESNRTALKAQVTFTNIPSGFAEFSTVYKEYLGKDVNGAAAMLVMAMEIYGRDNATGEKCLQLICNSATASEALRILKDRYSVKETDKDVAQRYIAAALLKGANRKNSYAPEYPYTIEFQGSANAPQETHIPDWGMTYYLYALGEGWDTNQRQCSEFLPEDETLFVCSGFPSFYTQCQTIKGDWAGLK